MSTVSRTPPPILDVDACRDHAVGEERMAGETEASVAVTAVARVLRSHVSPGEIADFRMLIEA